MNIEYLDVNIIADRTKYTKTQKQKEELSPLLLFFFSGVIYCDRLMANIDFALRTLAVG